jgi:hypothetical protein
VVVLVALMIASFFIEGAFFVGYGTFARVVSSLFLVLQAVALVDFAYGAHEWLISHVEGEDPIADDAPFWTQLCGSMWRAVYVGTAIVSFAAALGGLIALYAFATNANASGGGCPSSVALCSAVLVTCMAMVGLSSLDCLTTTNGASRGAVVPLLVCAYAVLQLASSFYANPDTPCNPSPSTGPPAVTQAAAIGVALITLLWSVNSATSALPGMSTAAEDADDDIHASHSLLTSSPASYASNNPAMRSTASGAPLPASDLGDAETAQREHDQWLERTRAADEAEDTARKRTAGFRNAEKDQSPWVFHAVMAVGAAFLAMLLTEWRTPDPQDHSAFTTSSDANFGVKVASIFIAVAVFAWTVAAPFVLPDRDFTNRVTTDRE